MHWDCSGPAVWGGWRSPAAEPGGVPGCCSIWSWPTPSTPCASEGQSDSSHQESLRSPCPQTNAAGASGRCRCPGPPPRLGSEDMVTVNAKSKWPIINHTLPFNPAYRHVITRLHILLHASKRRGIAALHGLQQHRHLLHLGGCELGVDALKVCTSSREKEQFLSHLEKVTVCWATATRPR